MFRLRTLGGIALDQDGVTLDAVGAQRKTLALLALLAAAGQRGISRDRLTAFLWPESDEERALGALKQALHVVRRLLGSRGALLGTSELRLDPQVIGTDVGDFLAAVESGDLERAVDLYAGPFLDGFYLPGAGEFERWAEGERDALARRYAASLEQLAAAAESRGDTAAAVRWWRYLRDEDPLSGRVTLALMRALDAAGERAAAVRCAQAHETLLLEELGLAPDPGVSALAARLREEPAITAAGDPGDPPIERPSAARHAGQDPPAGAAIPPAGPAIQPAAQEPPPSAGPARPPPRRAAMAAGSVALLGLLAVGLNAVRQRGPAAPTPTDLSIAVLPFVNPGGDSADAHFEAGFAEALVGALQRLEGVNVAPRTSVAALAKRGLDSPAIADSLGVSSVLSGTVRRTGGRLEVTARLVATGESRLVWAESYDREMRDVFALQEDIARGVAGALQLRLTSAAESRLVAGQTSDLEAYDLFLKGRHTWRRRTREGIEQSVVYYEQAIERDAGFAAAHAGLAEAYVNLSNFGYRSVSEALARAELAAGRALDLDPTLAEAHAARGFVFTSQLRFDDAEAAFRRSIALDPDYAWGHHYYTLLLLMQGRTDDAREQNRAALGADPLSLPANATRGIILCQQGDYAGARRELEAALNLAPDFPLTVHYLAVVRAALGHDAEATELAERAAGLAARFTGVQGTRAHLYQRAGRTQAADSLIEELRAGAAEPRTRANLAFALGALGRVDEAFAVADGVSWDVPSVIELRADPLLEQLRADPRYPRLLRHLGIEDR